MRKKYAFFLTAIMLSLTGCSNAVDTQPMNNYVVSDKGVADGADYPSSDSVEDVEEDSSSDDTNSDIKQYSDKLVYTCNIDIETMTYSETLSNIYAIISDYSGIIESEDESNINYSWDDNSGTMNINLKIRIPSEEYSDFLDSLNGQGKIISKSSNVENITKQYYETSAVIESLKVQEERLLEMMKSAESIEDMIAVESRLTEVQTSLNTYNNDLETMNTDVKYSTIYLNLSEVKDYTPEKDTFYKRFSNTVKESWQFFWNMLEFIFFFLIRIIPVAIVVIPIYFVIRYFNKRKRNKQQKND